MSTDQRPDRAELEAEIDQLRHSVGETVEALSHKLDVKARAQEKVRSTSPAVPAAGAAVVLAIAVWLWRRRRRDE